MRLLHSNPDLAKLIHNHPRLIYRYLGDYLISTLSTADKLIVLASHYKFLLTITQKDFFKRIQAKAYLWQEIHNNNHYSIALEFPFGRDSEGDLSLVVEFNSRPVYLASFTFIRVKVMPFQVEKAIFVGRMQGLTDIDLIRNTTKSLHDIAPPALLIAALQGIASACKITTLIGVSNDQQLSTTKKYVYFNYDSFWDSLGAAKTKYDLFSLTIPFTEKPIEQIKHNHRRRTLYKRQFKNRIRQVVSVHFDEFLR